MINNEPAQLLLLIDRQLLAIIDPVTIGIK
jgi:hypothetical protein